MNRKKTVFVSALLGTIIPFSVSANAFELSINTDANSGVVEGKVTLDEAAQYERVAVKVLNEENSVIYLDQIYTDKDGVADFSYVHDNSNALSGVMTVNVMHNGEVIEDTYTVEDKKITVKCNSIKNITDTTYEMSYTAKNISSEKCEVSVVTAVYETDGRLKSVEIVKKELAVGESVSETVSCSAKSGETIKTLFWNMKTLEPYCDNIVWNEVDETEPTLAPVVTEEPTPAPTPTPIPTEEPVIEPVLITLESESGAASFTPQLLTGTGVSGSLMHLYKKTFNPDTEYTIKYTFNCDVAGIYELCGVISEFTGYCAECSVSVNGGEAIHSSSAKKISDVKIGVDGLSESLLDKYSFGKVTLNKGTNTLVLTIEGKNWSNTSVSFDADYFEFAPVTAYAQTASVKAVGNGLNIFEKKDGMSFNVMLDGIASKEEQLQYTITDYFDNECVNSSISLSEGDYNGVINADELNTGWYKLSVTSELVSDEVNFVIVPNSDERIIDDNSAFATDLATAWHVDSHYKQRLYANAAKLAGSDWVRDRVLWREVESAEGIYNYNNVIGDTDTLKDAGLKVSNTFHEAPSWARTTGGTLPDNPRIMYNFIKNAADGLSAYVDVWEIWNEQDAYQFSKEGADKYAAMLKAASIAADSSDAAPLVALGGLCTRDSEYNNQMFQNGVMDYIDIYNYHTHLDYDTDDGGIPTPQKEQMAKYALLSRLYGIGSKPIWHTESGIRQAIKDGETQLNSQQCIAQAQHIVPAYLEAVAAGVDKQFSFVGIPLVENGADFGLFDEDGMPRQAYAVQAVMTKMLEGMSFYGTVNSIPEGATGYAMHNGTSIAEVLWSENECSTEIDVLGDIKVYDVMGNEIDVNVASGKATITLSPNPVYVVFNKNEAPDNIYVRQREFNTAEKTALTDADKVVLFAQFPVTNYETDKTNGYSFSYSDTNTVSVTVYNFSDKEMTGTLNAVAENDAFDVVCPAEYITIPAQGETVVNIEVSSNDYTAFCEIYDLKIAGTFNSDSISPVVSHITFDRGVNDYTLLHGSNSIVSYADGWQNPGASANISYSMTSESDGIQFALTGDGNLGMFYPHIYSRSQDLSTYDGIRMSVYFDRTVTKDASNYMTIQISDGSSNFVLDNSKLISVKEGWNDYSFKWSDFTHRVSGTAENIMDILGKYMYVRIGVHISQESLTYKLSDVGLFNIKEKAALPEITATAERTDGNIKVSALLPNGVMADKARVYYDGKETLDYTLTDKKLSFEYSNAAEGEHKILIVAYTPTGYAIYREINI